MSFWLMKTEPGVYSIDDLKRDGKTSWEGVRNYQARNFLRDSIKEGDQVLFYHSNAEPSGVAGIGKIVREGYPERGSGKEKAVWFMVDIAFVSKFPHFVPLEELKRHEDLKGMMVTQKGSRLSVQPVSEEHFKVVRQIGRG